ncbi:Arginyl-tRNA--protein transferase 1 [Hypoxylon texense]
MLQSGLLRCSLIIALGTIGVWANNEKNVGGRGVGLSSSSPRAAQVPQDGEPLLWNNFEHIAAKKNDGVETLIIERIPDSTNTSPKERAAPALATPRPTAPPPLQKRQDDGQIQALSSQLRSLSQSATQAISSVSSSASSAISLVSQSAQSVRQSADQAVQSANQNADNANRQLSQTQSSASSAVSAASARASDDLQRSLSSMSSRISSNLASAQSSASSAVSAARAAASSSAANAVNIAASQIQEARADASGVRGDANSIVTQVQSNSVSGTNVAIIVTVAVVGTAILTSIAAFFIVRYRRKKRRDREGIATPITTNNEKQYDKPIAVRGLTPGSPRFTPFGGGTGYPMDKFKLPDLTLSPFLRKKTNEDGRSSIGFAKSDFNIPTSGGSGNSNNDVYGVSPTSFRLQKKDDSVKSATSVRLIRVGSTAKGKAKGQDEDQRALLSPMASPAPPLPTQMQTPAPPPPITQPAPVQRVPVVTPPSPSLPPSPFPPPQPQPQPSPQTAEPPPVAAPPPAATRFSRASSTTSERTLNPPVPRTALASTQSRLRFRDSSDVESAEPSPMPAPVVRAAAASSMRNTNTASLRAGPSSAAAAAAAAGLRPKNAGPASFATFPRVRDGPPRGSAAEAIMNRSRGLSGVAVRLREGEEERRRRETGTGSREDDGSASGAGTAATDSKGPNWPFGSG